MGVIRVGLHLRAELAADTPADEMGEWKRKLHDNLGALLPGRTEDEVHWPSMLNVVATSINIMQVRISRSRMAGEPPDVIISPRLAHLGLLDFHRSREAIEEGRRAVEEVMPSLRLVCGKVAAAPA